MDIPLQTDSSLRANLLLLITALIWGLSFVAQRQGMEHMGPFTFNGARFMVGSISLLPVIFFLRRNRPVNRRTPLLSTGEIRGGLLLGAALFLGASLQQIGIVETTAGKAGFITGLYVIIVPLLGLFWKQQTHFATWIGAVLAALGMYLLSATDGLTLGRGDLLVLISALFWAIHVQLISWFSRRLDPLLLSFHQFFFCALFSWLSALQWEEISSAGIGEGLFPILFTGIFSVGIAYTLQVIAQKRAHPAHAAIILSLESVFAVLGGWLFLHEILSLRGTMGCLLMLTGMLLSQLLPYRDRSRVL
ncbi:MAG: DMT family transporter [Thermodesulfobacteriota bacterium]